VYKHWNSGDSHACPGNQWALLALNRRAPSRPSDPPQYADSTAQGAGSSAGDALWNTTLTMTTLKQWYGWCGYDGSCQFRANIVFDRPEGFLFGYGYFWRNAPLISLPANILGATRGHAVVVAQPVQDGGSLSYPYSGSASLDVMGHEWGHAVNWEANLQFGSSLYPQGPQLDEGFANVLGHGVEWLNRPAGRGYEKADWCFGEDHYNGSWAPNTDCPLFWSRADWFVEKVRTPNWQAVYPGTDYGSWCAYHRDQFTLPWPELPWYAVGDGHVQGHMLSVVLYLLSQGGQNPICPAAGRGGRAGWTAGCDIDVDGLGAIEASRILMRVAIRLAPSNTQWGDLADLAKLSAFQLYSQCPGWGAPPESALVEQQAANDAFKAIGYGGDETYYTRHCPIWP